MLRNELLDEASGGDEEMCVYFLLSPTRIYKSRFTSVRFFQIERQTMTAYSNQILLSLLTTRYSPILLRRFDISSDGKTVAAERK
ncbi:MAG: hypothetical protein WBP64_14755 [Nitrososphaeraceae archaeon]